MIKKTLFVVLCLILILSLMIIACSQQPKQQEPAKTDTTVGSNTVAESKDKEEQKKDQGDSSIKLTPPNTYPIVEEKVTLKIFTYQNPLVEDMETNQFTRELEELTNVHIEWDLAPQANLAEKRNLVLASGNYPDAFMSAGFSLTDLMTYGTQGVLIPLNDLIEEHAPNVKKHFEDIPTVKEKITAPDGNIYSLGSDQRCYHCGFSRKMWINQSWLDKLNLSMPTTTDEFYQVLKAFREQDPNGNGKADEIPLISAPSEVDIFLMNAFIYNEGGNRFILNDGKVDVAFNKPEWREGLAYLKKLYDEELLDHTSLTTTAEQIKQLANGEVELLGAFPALQPGTYCDLAGERWKHYSVVPPLKGPNGVQLAQYNAYPAAVDAFAITKECKYPEVAIRWADYFYTLEGALRSRIGREGHEWGWAEPGDVAINGQPAKWKKLTPLGQMQNYFWSAYSINYTFNHSEQAGDAVGLEPLLYNSTKLYEPYGNKDVIVPPLWLEKEANERVAQLAADINTYVNESLARFITGDLDLESDWDKYVKELENMGLAEYLEIYQKAYDAKYKK